MEKHQDVTKIGLKMDYNFEVGKPFMGINFHDTVLDIVNKLGEPERIERYNSDNEEYSLLYKYDNETFTIVLEYEYNKLDRIAFYTSCLQIGGRNLFRLGKREILQVIKSVSKIFVKDALDEAYEECGFVYEIYSFKDVGLMLWFKDDRLDDVCIYSPEVLEVK